ncbi:MULTISPECIES: hypothetical protein [unclassified Massilia]|uniref:hypothetical protein n=1 Tax=unclassified Massilia TaxID=2609279 RepID=UPI001B8220A2|nr:MULTISPECIES: hypothetical protein [unclassified Massilia]MBQ5940883.1 hypothetical protein [Massilia sp. AB1]MBQ5964544.1 hypothetical protein [Massilia sp. ZL223]
MDKDIGSTSDDKRTPGTLGARGAARRRFARAGVGATGIVLTLSSKGAMANACSSPSGFVSASLKGSSGPAFSCASNGSHGYWKNHQEEWGITGVKPTDLFGAHFDTGIGYAHLKQIPLIGVLDPNAYFDALAQKEGKKKGEVPPGFDPNNVAMQTIAAYLNARQAMATGAQGAVLTPQAVKKIWSDFVFDGSYLPSPGAERWGGAQIASYFEGTFLRK